MVSTLPKPHRTFILKAGAGSWLVAALETWHQSELLRFWKWKRSESPQSAAGAASSSSPLRSAAEDRGQTHSCTGTQEGRSTLSPSLTHSLHFSAGNLLWHMMLTGHCCICLRLFLKVLEVALVQRFSPFSVLCTFMDWMLSLVCSLLTFTFDWLNLKGS